MYAIRSYYVWNQVVFPARICVRGSSGCMLWHLTHHIFLDHRQRNRQHWVFPSRSYQLNRHRSQFYRHRITSYNVCYTKLLRENAQARERTQVLMDLANQYGGIVVGTGDLSELALGFCTYAGDQISMYGVNAGVAKTLIKSYNFV